MIMKKVIKKAEKLSGNKVQVDRNHLHWVEYNGYTISFRPNGAMSPEAEATNFYVKRIGDQDDLQSDYFAGSFWDNITRCFKFAGRSIK